MQLPPPSVLASFPAPNYVDPVVRGNANVIVNLIFYPIVVFMIIIRLYTRLRISKSFGADDYLICAALVPATAFATIGLLAELQFGWNRHVWDVPLPNIVLGLKFFLVTQIIFTLTQTLTKCSILALIYRIMTTAGGRIKIFTEVLFVIILIEAAIFIITVIFQCRPPSDYWTLTFEPQPNCIDQNSHVLAAGIINTCTDFLAVCFPLPTVMKLKLPRIQVVIVSLLFAAGGIVCIAGGVRTYYTYLETSGFDQTWAGYPVWLSGSVELYLGMMGASVPATKPFFQRFIPQLLNSAPASEEQPPFITSRRKKYAGSRVITSDNHHNIDIELGDFSKIGVVTALQTVKESSSMSSFNVTQQDKHTSGDQDGRASGMSFGNQKNSMDELVQKWNIK